MQRFATNLLFGIMFFGFAQLSIAQYKINIKVGNYTSDTIVTGYYYGDKQLVKDTLIAKKKGHFVFEGKDTLKEGIYLLLLKPDNSFVQFIINDNKKFDIEFDKEDLTSLKFKGSKENNDFYEYLRFLKEKRKIADPLREKIKKAAEDGKQEDPADTKTLNQIDEEVIKMQEKIGKEQPKTIFGQLIKANFEIKIPEFTGPEDSVKYFRYLYYREHYFDNFDFTSPSLLRTPYLHQRIDYFMSKLTSQDPDSLIIAIDKVLKNVKPVEETYRFYLSHFVNQYVNSKIIGMDKVFVHLADNYYAKGLAPWVKEENMSKIKSKADEHRNVLIGKIFPNITTYTAEDKPVVLHDIKADYTILIFWAPDCGHCTKSMPHIVKFYEGFKDKGVALITVCTKQGDKYQTCIDAIKEKHMENFINTGDKYRRWAKMVTISQTPKIFILDAKKEILIKDVAGEDLEKLMPEIIKVEEEKAKSKELKK